jgi:hypothetical protein
MAQNEILRKELEYLESIDPAINSNLDDDSPEFVEMSPGDNEEKPLNVESDDLTESNENNDRVDNEIDNENQKDEEESDEFKIPDELEKDKILILMIKKMLSDNSKFLVLIYTSYINY